MSSRPKIAKASLARLGGIADNLTSNGLATALTLRARRPSCRCRRNRILFAYRLGTGKTCRAQPPHVARRSWRHDGDGRLGVERVAGGTTVVRRPLSSRAPTFTLTTLRHGGNDPGDDAGRGVGGCWTVPTKERISTHWRFGRRHHSLRPVPANCSSVVPRFRH